MVVLVWVLPWALSDVGPDLVETLDHHYVLTDTGSLIRVDEDRVAWEWTGPFSSWVSASDGSLVLAMDEAGRFTLFDAAGRRLIAGDTSALADFLGVSVPPSRWGFELVGEALSLTPARGMFPRIWITELETNHPRLQIHFAEKDRLAFSGLDGYEP